MSVSPCLSCYWKIHLKIFDFLLLMVLRLFFVPGHLLACQNTCNQGFSMMQSSYKYLFNVTKVPVNFLHRRNAISSLFGSSLRKVSSRQTFSISHDKIPRKFCCKAGKRIFNSATILLKIEKIYQYCEYRLPCSN